MGKDYIPKGNEALRQWAWNLIEMAGRRPIADRLRIMEPPATLPSALNVFTTLIQVQLAPHDLSPLHMQQTRDAKAKLIKELRAFVQGFLARNPYMTPADRVLLGLPAPDTIPTNVPPPGIPPTGVFAYPAQGLVEIAKITSVAEPADARAKYGVRIYYGVLGEPSDSNPLRIGKRPTNGDALPHSVFTRRKRYRFDFTGEKGKEVFFCLRFENSKGQAGPWGEIMSTFIT